jgi:uncharacterized membrane protein
MANFDLFWLLSRSDSHGVSFSSISDKSDVAIVDLQPEEPDSDVAALHQRNNIDPSTKITKSQSEQQLENLLSNLLKYGVLIASSVVLFGGIIYLVHHGQEPARYHFFRGEPPQFCSPKGVFNAVLAGSDRAIIQLGLLLLVATPIVRVIISLFAFLRIRDFTYFFITLIVLACLMYSLL